MPDSQNEMVEASSTYQSQQGTVGVIEKPTAIPTQNGKGHKEHGTSIVVSSDARVVHQAEGLLGELKALDTIRDPAERERCRQKIIASSINIIYKEEREEKGGKSSRALAPIEELFVGGTAEDVEVREPGLLPYVSAQEQLAIIEKAQKGDYADLEKIFTPVNEMQKGKGEETLKETVQLRGRFGYFEGKGFKIFNKADQDRLGGIRIDLSNFLPNGLVENEWRVHLVTQDDNVSNYQRRAIPWGEERLRVAEQFAEAFEIIQPESQPYKILKVKVGKNSNVPESH